MLVLKLDLEHGTQMGPGTRVVHGTQDKVLESGDYLERK